MTKHQTIKIHCYATNPHEVRHEAYSTLRNSSSKDLISKRRSGGEKMSKMRWTNRFKIYLLNMKRPTKIYLKISTIRLSPKVILSRKIPSGSKYKQSDRLPISRKTF
jgi:hypothetical protein